MAMDHFKAKFWNYQIIQASDQKCYSQGGSTQANTNNSSDTISHEASIMHTGQISPRVQSSKTISDCHDYSNASPYYEQPKLPADIQCDYNYEQDHYQNYWYNNDAYVEQQNNFTPGNLQDSQYYYYNNNQSTCYQQYNQYEQAPIQYYGYQPVNGSTCGEQQYQYNNYTNYGYEQNVNNCNNYDSTNSCSQYPDYYNNENFALQHGQYTSNNSYYEHINYQNC